MPGSILDLLFTKLDHLEITGEKSDWWCSINDLHQQVINEIDQHQEGYISKENAQVIYTILLKLLIVIHRLLLINRDQELENFFEGALDVIMCDEFMETANKNHFSPILARFFHCI